MTYAFQLLPNPNTHYNESLRVLSVKELGAMLSAMNLSAEIRVENVGGADFLLFEAGELSADALTRLGRHSSLLLMAEYTDGLLRPLPVDRTPYLPKELAEVLKYKGKTGTAFTRMLINLAMSASEGPVKAPGKTLLLDPVCGRGTTLYCAMEQGINAVGIDTDKTDLREAMTYLDRFLTRARMKHACKQSALTCGKQSVPQAEYILADDKEHYQAGDTRSLRLLLADTGLAGQLLRKTPADLLVADLPYGIQHAPQAGQKPESFEKLCARVLPQWRAAMRKGAGAAISFNTLTLPRRKLTELMTAAGFRVLEEEPYGCFEHFVEQAVTRDVVVAVAE